MLRTTLLAIATLAGAAMAQPPGPGRAPGHFGPGLQPPPFGGARFLGAEAGMPGRIVKNAPYSADIVTETTQALPDGNRIHQTTTVRMYRDSEGRTRSEQSLKNLSGLAPNANLPQVIFINDPVSGANYALNPAARTANKSTWARPAGDRPVGRGPGPGATRGLRGAVDSNLKSEALGTQTVEGLQTEGTRTTITIPAGQIGNEQPIQIVTESWYAPDLQTVLLSKRSDPRIGETVTRVSNISRAEPSAALFQVPADYKISEPPARRGGASK